MREIDSMDRSRRQRIRSALLVLSALLLFLFGLFLLFAPAPGSDGQSRRRPKSFRPPLDRVDNGLAIAKAEFTGGGYFWSG
jgi:hypothetical protein